MAGRDRLGPRGDRHRGVPRRHRPVAASPRTCRRRPRATDRRWNLPRHTGRASRPWPRPPNRSRPRPQRRRPILRTPCSPARPAGPWRASSARSRGTASCPTRPGSSRRRHRPWTRRDTFESGSAAGRRSRAGPRDGRRSGTAKRARHGSLDRAPERRSRSVRRLVPAAGACRSMSGSTAAGERRGTGACRSIGDPARQPAGGLELAVGRPSGRPAQARAGTAVALKIEVCASSGSITPKIFCSVRRWTQEPQLSK